MNRKTGKRTLIVLAIVLGLFASIFLFVKILVQDNVAVIDKSIKIGLFSWNSSDDEYSIEDLFKLIKKLHVSRLYHSFEDNLDSQYSTDLIKMAANENIELYYLAGKSEWGLDENATELKKIIDSIATSNLNIEGITIDVEPYLLKDWQENKKEILNSYYLSMQTAYQYAKSNNLRVVLCIPNWLDDVDIKILEDLIANTCDEIAIMNYNKKDEIPAIKNEVYLAMKYDKPLECIVEFQDVGTHQLTEDQTYANDGLGLAIENFNKLYGFYHYNKIGFAYHYATPLMKMLKY